MRYAHHTYIKNHLPYISTLINRLVDDNVHARDLRVVFPLFVEDFINHIYEEEDELFDYISFLIALNNDKSGSLAWKIDKFSAISLGELQAHHVDEDEMAGIREMIAEMPSADLLSDVIKKEIQAFDREILYHAEIENELLFPGAIEMERKIFLKLDQLRPPVD